MIGEGRNPGNTSNADETERGGISTVRGCGRGQLVFSSLGLTTSMDTRAQLLHLRGCSYIYA